MKTIYYVIPADEPKEGSQLLIVGVGRSSREHSLINKIARICQTHGFYFAKRSQASQEFLAKFTNRYHYNFFDLLTEHPRVFNPFLRAVSVNQAYDLVHEAVKRQGEEIKGNIPATSI